MSCWRCAGLVCDDEAWMFNCKSRLASVGYSSVLGSNCSSSSAHSIIVDASAFVMRAIVQSSCQSLNFRS